MNLYRTAFFMSLYIHCEYLCESSSSFFFYVIWGRSIIYAAVPQNCDTQKTRRAKIRNASVWGCLLPTLKKEEGNDNKNNGSKLNWIWSWLTVITNNDLLCSDPNLTKVRKKQKLEQKISPPKTSILLICTVFLRFFSI